MQLCHVLIVNCAPWHISKCVCSPFIVSVRHTINACVPQSTMTSEAMASGDEIVSAPSFYSIVGFGKPCQDPVLLRAIASNCSCFVCEESMEACEAHELTKALGSNQISHKYCYNSVHSSERLAESLGVKSKLVEMRAKDPTMWRECMKGMVTVESRQRSNWQRREFKEYLQEMSTETIVRRRHKRLLLTRRRFIAWHKWHEGDTEAEAVAKWEAGVKDKRVYREGTGQALALAVELPTELCHEENVSKRMRLTERQQLDSEASMHAAWEQMQGFEPPGADGFRCVGRGAFDDGAALGVASSSSGAEVGSLLPKVRTSPSKAALSWTDSPCAPSPSRTTSSMAAGDAAAEAEDDQAHDNLDEPELQADGWQQIDWAKLSLPRFLLHKKQVRQAIAHTLTDSLLYSGKTRSIVDVIESTNKTQAAFSNDADIVALNIQEVLANVVNLRDDLKAIADRAIPTFAFKHTRDGTYKDCITKVAEQLSTFTEKSVELRQLFDVGKEIMLGMRRDESLKKRREQFKINKYGKVLRGGGFPESLSKHLGLLAKALDVDGVAQLPAQLQDHAWKADTPYDLSGSNWDVWASIKAMIDDDANMAEVQSQTAIVRKALTSTSIMKPLALNKNVSDAGDLHGLTVSWKSNSMRPWLLLATPGTLNVHMMKWPLLGLPSVVFALDDFVVLRCVKIEALLAQDVSIDKVEMWCDVDDKFEPDTGFSAALPPRAAIYIPFGFVCAWAYLPKNGIDRIDRGGVGRLLVQPVLPSEKVEGAPLTCKELAHQYDMFFEQHKAGPWVNVRDDVLAWTKSLV